MKHNLFILDFQRILRHIPPDEFDVNNNGIMPPKERMDKQWKYVFQIVQGEKR